MPTKRTIVIITHVFVPDPASVGQHVADAAMELAKRGNRVIVFTANRGYENPRVKYPARETSSGVEVVRLPFSSFGKTRIFARVTASITFLLQAIIRCLFVKHIDTVLVTTTPPLAPIAGIIVAGVRRAQLKYWVMDLNPDQAVAMGIVPAEAASVRIFECINRQMLRQADDIVALDLAMADRIRKKGEIGGRLHVLPPWPLEDVVDPVLPDENPWREAYGLQDKIVVMYSGNHTQANPLSTFLQAAQRVTDLKVLLFVFVGGGPGKRDIEQLQLPNVMSLPYQPLETLRYSLSAGDVHLVSIGEALVGIIHPCKAYGAMAVSRPIVALGPKESHLAHLVEEYKNGWLIKHGDVDSAEQVFRKIASLGKAALHEMGLSAQAVVRDRLNRTMLNEKFCNIVERGSIH